MRRLVFTLLAILLIAYPAYLVFQRVTWVEEELEKLAPFGERENVKALVARLEARPVDDAGFSFVVLGDSRSNALIAKQVFGEVAAEKPALVLSNGDIVRRGTVSEYLSHHLPLVELVAPAPVFVAPGNHEDGPNRDFAGFNALYGSERFSFDYGGCRFVGVNNADRNGMSAPDIDYLDTELAKSGAKHKFVIFHVPPMFLENYAKTEEGRGFCWNAGRLRRIMSERKVDHVFVGHIHGYATETIDGVYYTITGGAGASLAEVLGQEGNVHNYVVVHVTPDGLRREVVKLVDGEWQRSAIS